MRTALVAGATGLIGNHLLNQLLASDRYDKVIALLRQPIAAHPKLEQLQIDLGDPKSYESIVADDLFCCLGTTIAKAKSQENFEKVDYHYPLVMGEAMKSRRGKQYLLVSALGANSKSSIFYNRVKGEIEEAISHLGYPTVHIFRPSLLLGDRTEKRSGEDAAKWFYKFFGFLIPKKYKGIEGLKVAKAMMSYALADEKGVFIHESDDLQHF